MFRFTMNHLIIRVFPTPSIGIVGYTESYDLLIRNSFFENETVILIGKQINDDSDIGGSLYQRVLYDFLGGKVDQADPNLEKALKNTIFELRDKKLLGACVDVSEGGLFGALFEGIKLGNTGFKGSLIKCKDAEKALFGEISGRYVISTNKSESVKEILSKNNIPFLVLGLCTGDMLEFENYKADIQKLFDLYDNAIESEMER